MQKLKTPKLNREGMVEIGINQEEIEADEKENLETVIRGMKGTEKNFTRFSIVDFAQFQVFWS